MNSIVLVGNIARDIYRSQNNERPLVRLLLFSSHPRPISGLRVVLLDGKAKEYYDALKKGSEIGVIGHLVTRKHDGNFVAEVEARNLILLSNFPWGKINTQGVLADQGNGRASVGGTIGPAITFEWRRRKKGKFLGANDQFAYLQFELFNKSHPEGLSVVAFGPVAEFIFPYLRPKSEIAVDGLISEDKHCRRVIRAENAALLRNIDYIRAAAAQSRLLQMCEIDEQVAFE